MENPFLPFVDDLEKEAETFLAYYNHRDAIETPQPVQIEYIAKHLMSLDIVTSESLSDDESVQGAIAFYAGVVDVYDWNSKQYIGYKVEFPAIFVDADIINPGRYNNTLAHECYHWWKHRNYFNYERNYGNRPEFGIRCESIKLTGDSHQLSPVERMEWQARNMAPKILMPRTATKKKIESLYDEFLPDGNIDARPLFTESVISHLANFFMVSKQSAAIRMRELGYEEAAPFCNHYQDEIPYGYRRKRGISKARKRQQTVSPVEAFQLYCENEFLRTILDTGAFCYVDGYFVLRDNRFLSWDSNRKPHLTEYARENLHLCALDFSVRLIGKSDVSKAESYLLFRSDTVFTETKTFEDTPQNTELFNKAQEFDLDFKESLEEHSTANELLWRKMRKAHWNSEIFEEKTGLEEINYRRIQNNSHRFKMRQLIAMGIGLELQYDTMLEILERAGYTFSPVEREHRAYRFLFLSYRGHSIKECNALLELIGDVPLLGTQHRKTPLGRRRVVQRI